MSAVASRFVVSRLSRAANFLLVVIIVTALMGGPIVILYLLYPNPLILWFVPVCFLVALEGILTTQWLAHASRRQMSHFQYRLAEWVVILAALRLLVWLAVGEPLTLDVLRAYIFSPLQFFDIRFVVLALLAFLAWERTLTLCRLVEGISLSEAELAYYSLPGLERSVRSSDRPVDPNRRELFAGLMKNWIAGAMLLTLCAAISTVRIPPSVLEEAVDLRQLTRLGLHPGIMLSLLVYFIAGLWLIARLRMVALRTRWIVAGVKVQAGLERSWYRASILLLLAIALLAAFLPIGSTTGIAVIIAALSGAVLLVGGVIISLISAVLYFLLNLFGVEDAPPPAQVPVTPPPRVTPAPPPGELSETAAFLLGSSFWEVVVVIVVISVFFFLRGRGYLPSTEKPRGWFIGFREWLRSLWRRASRQVGAVGAALRERRPGAGQEGAARSPLRFIRLGALSAREQILYFYLSTVRRAGESGRQRPQSATPQEYAQELKEGWPEVGEDIEQLTEAFERARYSAEHFDRDAIPPVKGSWQRVRAKVRRR